MQPDTIPISLLNALEYCPRRFYYEFVQGEMLVNAPVLDGILKHETAHTAGSRRDDGVRSERRVYVYSDELRVTGLVDVVETTEEGWTPVEYKRSKMGDWLNDHVQLCAQALCLEERTGQTIAHGYLFYFGNRRRERVEFTPELRARTRQAIAQAFQLAAASAPPPPLDNRRKCRDCSLEPLCLPAEVMQLQEGFPSPHRGEAGGGVF